jgi:hypothetical protein
VLANTCGDIVTPVVDTAWLELVDPAHCIFDLRFVIEQHAKFDELACYGLVGDKMETDRDFR